MKTLKGSKKVVVAMSGGVDSSVAALLLKQQGYEVIGLMLKLWSEDNSDANRCCTPDSIDLARQIADSLEIPFYVRDYKEVFKKQVVEYFVETYAVAETPNPCLVCNKTIRFGKLLDEALGLGADCLATGHYARILQDQNRYHLFRGVDPLKDQSYVLYRLDQKQLSHVLFPLGEMDKKSIRKIAEEYDLPIAHRPDSQDLCFIGDERYDEFLKRRIPQTFEEGEIRTKGGRVLGRHRGLPAYTIGQRRGLGVSYSEPLYVLELDREHNHLVVGTEKERISEKAYLTDCCFLSGIEPDKELSVEVKIRYTAKEVSAKLVKKEQGFMVLFGQPQKDVTPGQAAVFYQGDEVIGGGVILPGDKMDTGKKG